MEILQALELSEEGSIHHRRKHGRSPMALDLTEENNDEHDVILDNTVCAKCGEGFDEIEQRLNAGDGEVFHEKCFVCVQCFQPFANHVFFKFGDRRYCENDFKMLFALYCAKCGEFVSGRVMKTWGKCWHPQCFICELCGTSLENRKFYKNEERALCEHCNKAEKAARAGKPTCHKCHTLIDAVKPLVFLGQNYHHYHFDCHRCHVELTSACRERERQLYCLRCHDRHLGVPICRACRRPIEEERHNQVEGQFWHLKCFVCSVCETPFEGRKHRVKHGKMYCEMDYLKLFGPTCHACQQIITGDMMGALQKRYCVDHFTCFVCDKVLRSEKPTKSQKFYEYDMKPVCNKCHDKFPKELKKRLAKMHKEDAQQ